MGSLMGAIRDDEAREYEEKYGERDRKADRQLKSLRERRAGEFTVEELSFVLDPWSPRHQFKSIVWNEHLVKRVDELYTTMLLRDYDG